MRKNKLKIIALILSVVLFSHTSLADYVPKTESVVKAEESSDKKTNATAYVSDLRLYKCNGASRPAIMQQAEQDGYKLVKDGGNVANLNQYTERDDIYLGYKTSKNQKDAITDVRMLEMEHGYEWYDYQTIAEKQMDKMETLSADINIAAKEFKEKVENKNRFSVMAKDYLNMLYFFDVEKINKDRGSSIAKNHIMSKKEINNLATKCKCSKAELVKKYGIKMGDYLSSGKLDTDFFKKCIIQMNTGSLTALYSQLALGVADSGKTWAERIEETSTYKSQTKKNAFYNAYYDNLYFSYSVEMKDVIRRFATNYDEAMARKEANNGEYKETKYDSDEEKPNADNVKEIMDASGQKGVSDFLEEVTYDLLNKYKVGDEKLGDYILRLGRKDYSSNSDYRELYPLVEAMTDGQYSMIKIVGFEQMVLNLSQTDDYYNELEKKRVEAMEAVNKASDNIGALYIFEGVNTELFEREAALTSEALRQSNANTLYTDLTKEGNFDDNLNLAYMYVGLAASVAGLITGCIYLGLLIAGSSLTVWGLCAGGIGAGIAATIGGVIGCAAVIVGWAALIALIVMAFISLGRWIYSLFKDEDKEDYTPMPRELYDINVVNNGGKKANELIKYEVVENSAGNPQDINADDGKRWNLLYYTKKANYGSPICVDKEGKAFVRTVSNPSKPQNCDSVALFGGSTAANLNSYVRKKDCTPIYLHFITQDKLDGITVDLDDTLEENEAEDVDGWNKGTKTPMLKSTKYIHSLKVCRGESESEAKAGITKEDGFHVFDRNLTPGDQYTYLGYSYTSIKKEAITDIRVVPNSNRGAVLRGNASYGWAGDLTGGYGLYFTSSASAGTPIVDDFRVSNHFLGMNYGYEPVNWLCGGQAHDMNSGASEKVYLYFKPSVTYTSGEKYLGGLQFLSSRKTNKTKNYTDLISKKGMTAYPENFASGNEYPVGKDKVYYCVYGSVGGGGYGKFDRDKEPSYEAMVEKLCYTETYNPYRAVYDLALYTKTPKANGCDINVTTSKGNYTVVENTMVSDGCFFNGYPYDTNNQPEETPSEDEEVRVLKSRAYIDPYCCSENPYRKGQYKLIDDKALIITRIEENYDSTNCNYRAQGMYILGCTGDKTQQPLKASDIKVNKSTKVPEGMHSIYRLTNPYNKRSISCSFVTHDNDASVYVYIKGEAPKKKKYISAIHVNTYTRPGDTNQHKLSDDEKKAYDALSDDIAIAGALSEVNDGEVLNYNVAVDQGSAWYNKATTDNSKATYLSVDRTDDEAYAIRGVLVCKSKTTPPVRLKVDGVEYNRAGDGFNDKYIYYTKSIGASPGLPLKSITFDEEVYEKGAFTAFNIEPKEDKNAVYSSKQDGENGYFHLHIDEGGGALIGMKVIEADSLDKAMFNAMKSGYGRIAGASLNYGVKNKGSYLAFRTCAEEMLELEESYIEDASDDYDEYLDNGYDDDITDDGDDIWSDFDFDFDDIDVEVDEMIYDVIAVMSHTKPEETIERNGVKYELVSDVSTNEGTDGDPIYLYCTHQRKLEIGDTKVTLKPIKNLCLCSGDASPGSLIDMSDDKSTEIKQVEDEYVDEDEIDIGRGIVIGTMIYAEEDGEVVFDIKDFLKENGDQVLWEHVLDDEGHTINLNSGNFVKDKDGHLEDKRLNLFAERVGDDAVKPGAEIYNRSFYDVVFRTVIKLVK